MAKNSIRDFSATAGSNTDIQSVNIDENCPASGINNAIRELMVDLKNVSTGAVNLETPAADQLDVDNIRIDGNTISSTDTNGDITLDPNGTGDVVVASGKVGIGESSPATPLHISTAASTTAELRLTSNNTGSGSGDRGRIAVHSSRNDGTAYEAGRIDIDRSSGTEDKAHILFATNNGSGVAERMRIDSSGDVGIGTTTNNSSGATRSVSVNAASGMAAYEMRTGDVFTGYLGNDGTNLYLVNAKNGVIGFFQNNTERMRIDNSGNLLIGATSRSNVERVNISYPRTTHCGMVIDCTDSTAATAAIKFFNTNGDVGSIDMSGSSTSYNTSSDARLKENVADMTGAIDRVKALAPKRFNFIADPVTTVDGFLAHEAQAVVPEAVTGTHNEVDDDGNAVMQGIDQAKLVPLLTGALQEAIAKIETLETEMTALKARVTALEA